MHTTVVYLLIVKEFLVNSGLSPLLGFLSLFRFFGCVTLMSCVRVCNK
jgi:hypothetical protein